MGYETSTSSSSITAPTISGYTYQGYVYYDTWQKCVEQGKKGNYDGTGYTCSGHGSSNPYVVFFYEEAPKEYYWRSYDLTNSSYITSSTTTTNSSISAPSYSNYDYAGYVHHTSFSSCISQGSNRNFDGTSSTASASTKYPYVVFFYDYNPPTYYTYITYYYNGGSGSYTEGTQYTFSSTNYTRNVNLITPTRTDYTFLGWSTNNSSVDVSNSISVSGNKSYTLYALWSRNTITVSYNANGGSGAPSSSSVYTNSSFNINNTTFPTRSGYIFKGWSTSSTAKTATYKKGTLYTISTGTSNITYYAVWWTTFSWNSYNDSEANTFASYVNTYLGATINTINDNSPLRLAVWYNAIATALNSSIKVSSGDTSFKTQLDTLLTVYNNY